MKYVKISVRLIVAIILLQTLYFKFTASAESVYIFSSLGLEPYGRIGIGVAELIAAALILSPKWNLYGALLAIGLMFGAIASHLGPLGIEVMNDGGELFYLALIVFLLSLLIVWFNKSKLIEILESLMAILRPKS